MLALHTLQFLQCETLGTVGVVVDREKNKKKEGTETLGRVGKDTMGRIR